MIFPVRCRNAFMLAIAMSTSACYALDGSTIARDSMAEASYAYCALPGDCSAAAMYEQ